MKKTYTFILAIALLSLSILTPTSKVSAYYYDTSHTMSDRLVGGSTFYNGSIGTFGPGVRIHKFTTHRSGTALFSVVHTNYGGPLLIQVLDSNFNVIPNHYHTNGLVVQANETYYLKVTLTGTSHPNGASYVYMGHYVV
ncbi:hypothetical protein [Paenibacillus paeoniae]|uniref:DUF4879 domain-containing protein n=1 Tax=Paenibacillus paeoniae TaxID=2292705 RepID=A0A371PLX2_9BACL|nr:hypothetical protein [Paenibacillus paeoniae]REK76767.1 hypothetical protein DX130_06960 [Paenibacillus paeoniae]